MTKIVFLDRGTFGPTVELVRPLFEHQWQTYEQTAERDVPARLKGASIAITNKVPIRRAALCPFVMTGSWSPARASPRRGVLP